MQKSVDLLVVICMCYSNNYELQYNNFLVADQLKIQIQDRKDRAFRQFDVPVNEIVQNISNRYCITL